MAQLFTIGGVIPIVLALVLWKVLPESPRYLAKRRERWPELTRTMRRIGHDIPDDVEYTEAAAATATVPVKSISIGSLFGPTFLRDTLALCASFFFCLMVNYVAILLLPAMLLRTSASRGRPPAARAAAMSNYGRRRGRHSRGARDSAAGVAHHDAGHVGGRDCLRSSADGGIASTRPTPFLMVMLLLHWRTAQRRADDHVRAGRSRVSHTDIRSTGVGFAVAFGRIGNVLAGYVGGFALDRGGRPAISRAGPF